MAGIKRMCFFQLCFFLLSVQIGFLFSEEKVPLCRIGVISTPYITAQTEQQLGPRRSFLTKTGPSGLAEAFRLAEEQKISTLIILGDLTWTGSEADVEKLKGLLEKFPGEILLVPGQKDLTENPENLTRILGPKYSCGLRYTGEINRVRLVFNALPLENSQQQESFLDYLGKEATSQAQALLLFGQIDKILKLPSFQRKVADVKLAAAIIPGHSHNCDLTDSLPVWSAPTASWSDEGNALGIISVFPEKLELALYRKDQPLQVLTVPNPVKAARLDARKDTYLLPPYSEDLARKPELTFVVSGDPQFDDLTEEKYRNRFSAVKIMNEALVQEVNRLKPDLIFIAGDLTNKHTLTEWKLFVDTYQQLTIPAYPLAGNHDRLAGAELEEIAKKDEGFTESLGEKGYSGALALFQFFTRGFPSAGKTYYTVEKKDCAFICLDSSAMDTKNGGLGSQQLAWLEKELERTKNFKHVFILSHYPVYQPFGNTGLPAYQPEREKILSLLKKYRVAGFFCGHRHFSASSLIEGTFHLIADDFCWGEYTSYWIIHVFPEKIVYCWKPFQAPRHGLKSLYERIIVPEPRAGKGN